MIQNTYYICANNLYLKNIKHAGYSLTNNKAVSEYLFDNKSDLIFSYNEALQIIDYIYNNTENILFYPFDIKLSTLIIEKVPQ